MRNRNDDREFIDYRSWKYLKEYITEKMNGNNSNEVNEGYKNILELMDDRFICPQTINELNNELKYEEQREKQRMYRNSSDANKEYPIKESSGDYSPFGTSISWTRIKPWERY